MRKFTHLLLTSWNLNANNQSIYDNPKFDAEKWMAHRELLFDSIVVPMMRAQTCKNFIWVFSFDRERTPLRIIQKYESLPGFNVRIIYEMHKPWIWDNYTQFDTEWLVTQRMDNDDCLWPPTIEMIQKVFKEADYECLVDFFSVFWDIENNRFFMDNRTAPNSPFLAIMENMKNHVPRTAFHDQHTFMPKHFPSQKFQQYLGMCGITSQNQLNRVAGSPVDYETDQQIRRAMDSLGIKVPAQLRRKG